ncbi:4'-phosphopantetheinyl transferase [Methylomagnum ishizawai]|uniref:4'-phosphopantetheinyl transferase n=1 Tax=Methylomagnum ishizawai TaxID=1760988 RepID=A0A1Y6DBV5_9GAMM|nr:4'-phosphopantetheinyl transferase superfamily protein [Methylomagnum ishizawai]SMF97095.1 4'-phosphopantetheinyl transferase [Methylomagnum ishizawai]
MLILDDATLHIWRHDFATVSRWVPEPEACLAPDEHARAARLRSPEGRAAFVWTRAHLRVLLGAYLGCGPLDIAFEPGAYGKPRLAGSAEDRGLVFNVSHTGGAAALAFARDTALGVDIEAGRPHRDLERLAAFCLAPAELAVWQGLAPDARPAAFTRLWVCKEAFVKATGRGLALGLTQVVVDPVLDRYGGVPADYGPARDWRLNTWESMGYRMALAYRGPERTLRFFDCAVDGPGSGL